MPPALGQEQKAELRAWRDTPEGKASVAAGKRKRAAQQKGGKGQVAKIAAAVAKKLKADKEAAEVSAASAASAKTMCDEVIKELKARGEIGAVIGNLQNMEIALRCR